MKKVSSLDFLHVGMKKYSVVTNLIFPRITAIEKLGLFSEFLVKEMHKEDFLNDDFSSFKMAGK